MIKDKKNREPTAWNIHVNKVRAEHPGMKAGDLYKLAKKTYIKKEKK